MEKLISLSKFVSNEEWKETGYTVSDVRLRDESFKSIIRYNNKFYFLKQPLNIGMFVPAKLADGVWVVLEEPKENDFTYTFDQPNGADTLDGDSYDISIKEYQEAKERVLFEDFTIRKQGQEIMVATLDNENVWVNWNGSKKIEDLVYLKPKLSETAKKQLS